MRSVELAKVAASAEALRLRRVVRRQGMRAAYGAVAAVFAIGVLVLVHVTLYHVLTPAYVTPTVASLILLALDLVIAGVMAVLAMSDKPDSIEDEAKTIRQQAVIEMRKSMTLVALAGETAGAVLRRPRRVTLVQPRSTLGVAGELAAKLMARR